MTGYPRTHFSAATAAVTNRFVTSTNMKVGEYTVVNSGTMPTDGARLITVTHTQVGGVSDTLGTIVVVGTNLRGATITETITPTDGGTATGTKYFKTVTTVTGAGWVINTGNDTLVVGCTAAAIVAEGQGVLHGLVVNTAAAGAVTIADAAGTIAVIPSNQAAGSQFLWDALWSGYLSVTAAAATDITVLHTASLPSSYALS